MPFLTTISKRLKIPSLSGSLIILLPINNGIIIPIWRNFMN